MLVYFPICIDIIMQPGIGWMTKKIIVHSILCSMLTNEKSVITCCLGEYLSIHQRWRCPTKFLVQISCAKIDLNQNLSFESQLAIRVHLGGFQNGVNFKIPAKLLFLDPKIHKSHLLWWISKNTFSTINRSKLSIFWAEKILLGQLKKVFHTEILKFA
jgi:hypothetical protein